MKKYLMFLLGYLALFSIFFVVALYNYLMDAPVLDVGLDAPIINLFLVFLSVLGIVKTVYHILHH